MKKPDRVEFYAKGKMVVGLESSIVPRPGEMVSIRKQTWEVLFVSYAVDYADYMHARQMCANVVIKMVK